MTTDLRTDEPPTARDDSFLALADGTPVIVHPVRREDRAEVAAFTQRLSLDSIELRYSAPMRAEAVIREILGDGRPEERLSLLMETLEEVPRVVGTAEYVRYAREPRRAEVAFLVADEFQGRTAGTLLLYDLARRARSVGIRWFSAIVMAENGAMCDVFRHSGFPSRSVREGPTLRIDLDIGEAVGARPDPDPTRIEAIGPTAVPAG